MKIITISREFGSGAGNLENALPDCLVMIIMTVRLSLRLPSRTDWMRAMWKGRWKNGTGRPCL